MRLFPFMTRGADTSTLITINTHKEYGFDFQKGKLTNKVLEGKEALKVWIYKTLLTTRYTYPIYSWDYGQDLDELIGQGYEKGFIESEVERRIKECLLVNDKITGCTNFEISLINDSLKISFTAQTVFGEVTINDI